TKEALTKLDTVLEPGRAVVHRNGEGELAHQALGHRPTPAYPPAVAGVDAVAVFAHLLLVRLGELELVQVDKIDADRVEGHQEASEFGLLLGQDRYLHAPADSPVGGGLEDRAVSSSVARKRAPKVVRDVQPELIETRAGEPRELLGIRLVGVEVDVVVGPELALEEPDIVLHPIDDPERVSAGDPGARSADGARFLENVAVRADTAFVRVDDVQLVAGRGDGTVE